MNLQKLLPFQGIQESRYVVHYQSTHRTSVVEGRFYLFDVHHDLVN